MRKFLTLGLLIVLGSAISSRCQQAVELTESRKLLHDVDALPQILKPNLAAAKINADLAHLNRWARSQAQDCSGLSEAGDEMFWNRKVSVTSRGPLFLGIVVKDNMGCGGVHPYSLAYALTYDLRTGNPVHWLRYFKPGTGKEVSGFSGDHDPAKVVCIHSMYLQRLFVRKNPEMADVLSEVSENNYFVIYPAPNHRGLAMVAASVQPPVPAYDEPVYLGEQDMKDLDVPENIRAALLH